MLGLQCHFDKTMLFERTSGASVLSGGCSDGPGRADGGPGPMVALETTPCAEVETATQELVPIAWTSGWPSMCPKSSQLRFGKPGS